MSWSGFLDYLQNLRGNLWEWFDRVRQDRNVIVFLIFLIISTGFWFLNALRKDYTATLVYPVKFENIPEDKMLPDDLKKKIFLKVRAGGFVILRYQLSNTFLPLTFDVSEMKSFSSGNEHGVYTITKEGHNRIVGQLSQGMELIEIEPDTLFVPLMERGNAKVPVLIESHLTFEKQFLQSGPVVLNPDSVEIFGPKSIIDTLNYVTTRPLVFESLSDTVATMVNIELPSQIKSPVKRVNAMIPVEPFTELNVSVPLRINGLPDSLRIKTFPSEIQISYRVGISKYEKIDRNMFRAVVDLEKVFEEGGSDRLKVRMERVPDGVESFNFSPIFVEYLLEKKR
jgi:hypothetical protein